jgi:hypothetical protein
MNMITSGWDISINGIDSQSRVVYAEITEYVPLIQPMVRLECDKHIKFDAHAPNL